MARGAPPKPDARDVAARARPLALALAQSDAGTPVAAWTDLQRHLLNLWAREGGARPTLQAVCEVHASSHIEPPGSDRLLDVLRWGSALGPQPQAAFELTDALTLAHRRALQRADGRRAEALLDELAELAERPGPGADVCADLYVDHLFDLVQRARSRGPKDSEIAMAHRLRAAVLRPRATPHQRRMLARANRPLS